ncbi:Plant invertase/pectin methylesterase inhibitor superfamily protein [Abeliophyllum distichum]|uniref:Plant invertase/pectin methylesterase inhibitor superfamily protein n=1 Tax=Abeliophyllum distichum TaxID=126358 RepID=A0ABD1RAC1_9LAMI
MKNLRQLSLLFLLFIAIFFQVLHGFSYRANAAAAAAAAATTANATDFIRECCKTTLYCELCYNSLAGYSTSVQKNPVRLTSIAVNVSLTRAKRMEAYFFNISRQVELHAADPRAASALLDCCTLFDDAVHLIRDSLKQMGRLKGSGEALRFQISNIQTWMSAALTNEDTCTDGFDDVPEGTMKTDVCDKVVIAKQMTSNALAFVNRYMLPRY